MIKHFKKLFDPRVLFVFISGAFLVTIIGVITIYVFVVPKLPSIDSLKDVQLQVPLKVYTSDERLIAEFGKKKRAPVNIDAVPENLVNAVLAAEDDRFFEHPGVDIKGLLRAVVYLLKTGEKGQGGSTITMQVARNFFLSREKTYLRKLNEILLSLKIEQEISKKEILELYLNKIYLGHRSYGFAAAAQVYYGKRLDELTVGQTAMIAGLPKAPSAYNPITNPERALQRRNYVLGRMRDLDKIDQETYDQSLAEVDTAELHGLRVEVDAPYVAEMVRAEMYERFGEDAYTNGYKVFTTVDSRLQTAANDALRRALHNYEERHGFRGPLATVEILDEHDETVYRRFLSDFRSVNEMYPALVLKVNEKDIELYQATYGHVKVAWEGMSWAAPWLGDGKYPGAKPKEPKEVVTRGDIVRIIKLDDQWRLTQEPAVEGSLVSLRPRDGALLALVGGFNFHKSNFNRALQAERQPGSNIKPFNYSAALEKGFTAASLINDAPIVFEDAGLEGTWRPENYTGKVYGPTRLREALVNSRNLVSIRLLNAIGIPYAIKYLTERFGLPRDKLPRDLSLSLGSAAITPMQLVTGYAVFANGGYKVEPYFIKRVENDENIPILKANPLVVCPECEAIDRQQAKLAAEQGLAMDPALEVPLDEPLLVEVNLAEDVDLAFMQSSVNGKSLDDLVPDRVAQRVVPQQNVYIMTTMMRDVVQHGTGRRALALGRNDLAGKTGTTNDQQDAWFSGFNPDVVATAWVGFDTPQTLGGGEFGSTAALPMWIDYMRVALDGIPNRVYRQPRGLVSVRIDKETGELVGVGNPNAIFEIFREGHVPKRRAEDDTSPIMLGDPSVEETAGGETSQGGDETGGGGSTGGDTMPEALF